MGVNSVFLTFQLLISVIVGTGHQLLLELFQKELHYWNIPRGLDAVTKKIVNEAVSILKVRQRFLAQITFVVNSPVAKDRMQGQWWGQSLSLIVIPEQPSTSLLLAEYLVILFPQEDHTFQTHWISCHWWCGYAHCGPISKGTKTNTDSNQEWI